MNTLKLEILQRRLLDISKRFIAENGGLPIGKQVSVSVSIGPAPQVQIQIENNLRNSEFEKKLLDAIKRIPNKSTRTRLRGCLADKRLFTLDQIKKLDQYALLRIRRVGRKSVFLLAQALNDEGVTAHWIQTVLAHKKE